MYNKAYEHLKASLLDGAFSGYINNILYLEGV